ncbi:MAG: anthranilate synthase component I, partial [Gammaproteobacteria bacterium]
RIAVNREIMADLETPLTCYLKLANQPYSYLFESVQGGEKWARYSIIGLPCQTRIQIEGDHIKVISGNKIIEETQTSNPFSWIRQYQKKFTVAKHPDLPHISGGLVGYFSYDTVRYIETRLGACPNSDPLSIPDIILLVSNEVILFDNLKGTLHLLTHVDPQKNHAWEQAQQRLDELEQGLKQPYTLAPLSPQQQHNDIDFNISQNKPDYIQAIKKIKRYISDGDVMQVVYSLRLETKYEEQPLQLYRALRCLNPSPYMYYLNFDNFQVVGSSPEILVRVENGDVTVKPIAGTRKRGQTTAQDAALEKELLSDPKELAEHLMLIDLGRNDIGRVSETGSVNVTEHMAIERYSHVMHIVSEVQGRLKAGYDSIDALCATLPAGTLSGAPKVRAMEIIDELETIKRGIYGGAIGYFSWEGNLDTAIAIRTAIIKDQMIHVQAGGGIVYDSDPELEWQECMNKAKAIASAIAMVKQSL